MSIANVILHGVAMAGTWLTCSGFGGMVGNFAATVFRKSAEEKTEWAAFGNAVGCGLGLPVALCALVFVPSL